jgi:hypothetical protein
LTIFQRDLAAYKKSNDGELIFQSKYFFIFFGKIKLLLIKKKKKKKKKKKIKWDREG